MSDLLALLKGARVHPDALRDVAEICYQEALKEGNVYEMRKCNEVLEELNNEQN